MALYEWGGPAISSTGAGTVTGPSTASLIAEVDSTQLQVLTGSSVLGTPRGHAVAVRVTATLGAGSTSADWRLEQCLSTGLGSTALRFLVPSIFTPPGQSGMYVYSMMIEPGDRIRARLNSSLTGAASAMLQVDPLT
jgi:hypothetical protein